MSYPGRKTGAGVDQTNHQPHALAPRLYAIAPTDQLCAELHNRMPVVLRPQAWPARLGEQPARVPELKALLAPYPSDEMICSPVSARVGNVKNKDPSLIAPIAAA